ncbi:MAG: hypothetical protein HY234_14055 [Acidobacteria bacterium]|nr:hypothetical protein [Acidobacteriota bacterium]
MAQVDAIQVLSPSKTVILGRVQASVQIVTVVDNETARVTDSFLCFRPVVSPSGQFVAYVKVFPIHFVEGVSNEYLIYDFESTAVENRGPGIPITNDIDVGFPIFPLGSSNLPGDNVSVVEKDRHMLASERFFWSADSKNLAFVDWSNGRASIVVAEISRGSRIPRIASKPLDPQEISNSEHCKEYRDKLAFSFVVTQIEFLSFQGSHVRLKFRFNDPGCKRLDSIDLSLP